MAKLDYKILSSKPDMMCKIKSTLLLMVTFHSSLHRLTSWVSKQLSAWLEVPLRSDRSITERQFFFFLQNPRFSAGFSGHFFFSFFLLFSLFPSQSSSEEIMTAAAQRSQRVKQQGRSPSASSLYSCSLVICHSHWQAYCRAMTLSARYLTLS